MVDPGGMLLPVSKEIQLELVGIELPLGKMRKIRSSSADCVVPPAILT